MTAPRHESSTKRFTTKSRTSLIGLFIGTCALTMTACASPTPLSVASPRPPIPADLTQPCPALSPLRDGTGAAILGKIAEVAELYYECKRKHERLVEAAK